MIWTVASEWAHAAAWGMMVTHNGLGDDSSANWQLSVLLGEAPG